MLNNFLNYIFGKDFNNKMRSNFIGASFGSVFLQLTLSLLTFLSTIVIARIAGDKGFGIYSLVFTWVSILGSLALFGLDDLSIKQISILKSKNQTSEIKYFTLWGIRIALLSSISVTLFYILCCYFLPFAGMNKYKEYHIIAAFTIPFFVLIYFFQSILKGFGLITFGQIAEKLLQPLSFILFLIIFYHLNFIVNDFTAIILRVLSFVLAFVFIVLIFLIKFKKILRANTVTIDTKLWRKSMIYFSLSTLLFAINSRIDIIFLGFYNIEPEQIAYYNVALKFSDIALIPFLVISTVATPIFASLYHKAELIKLQKFYTLVTRISFIILLFIVIIFIVFGQWFLNWYGNNFISGYDVLVLLCISKLLHVFVGPVNNLLSMIGFEKYVTRALLFSVTLTIFSNFLFVPYYGILGSAWSALVGLFFFDFYLVFIGYKYAGIHLTVFGKLSVNKK